jgi:hypothetical protein
MGLDGIMALHADDMRGLLLRSTPGLILTQPGGEPASDLRGGISGYLSVQLIIWLRFFGIPAARPTRRVA